jgi:AcrR family transcriptional regulator
MRTLDPVRHEEKRREILAAAECCIARDGFRGASTADICKEAGISPGHLYHYFLSKEAIITAITAAGLENVEARFAQMMQSSNAITALVSQLDRIKGKRDGRMRARGLLVLDMLAEAGRNPAIAKIVRKNTATLRVLLVEFLRNAQARGQIDQGLDANVTAGVLLSVMDGMKTLGIRDPDVDIAKSIEHLQLLISRFLSPPRNH